MSSVSIQNYVTRVNPDNTEESIRKALANLAEYDDDLTLPLDETEEDERDTLQDVAVISGYETAGNYLIDKLVNEVYHSFDDEKPAITDIQNIFEKFAQSLTEWYSGFYKVYSVTFAPDKDGRNIEFVSIVFLVDD